MSLNIVCNKYGNKAYEKMQIFAAFTDLFYMLMIK